MSHNEPQPSEEFRHLFSSIFNVICCPFFDGGGRGLDFSDIVFVYNLSDMTSKSPTVSMLTKC
jgi:hypothetical protein